MKPYTGITFLHFLEHKPSITSVDTIITAIKTMFLCVFFRGNVDSQHGGASSEAPPTKPVAPPTSYAAPHPGQGVNSSPAEVDRSQDDSVVYRESKSKGGTRVRAKRRGESFK